MSGDRFPVRCAEASTPDRRAPVGPRPAPRPRRSLQRELWPSRPGITCAVLVPPLRARLLPTLETLGQSSYRLPLNYDLDECLGPLATVCFVAQACGTKD